MRPDDRPLVPFGDGLWLAFAPVSSLGLRLTTTMTVVRLSGGALRSLVVGHGQPVAPGAQEALAGAYAWLAA